MKNENDKLIQNELCFDTKTVASKKLDELKKIGLLDAEDKKIVARWEKVLQLAKAIPESKFRANYKYGLKQIIDELDTYDEVPKGLKIEKKYHHAELHNNIGELKKEVKQYYEKLIEPLLFEYELIK